MNSLYQKLAIINCAGISDSVEDGADGSNTGVSMEPTESLFADRFDVLGESTLVVRIIFILTAGSRHGSASIVDGFDGDSSRVHGRILRV